MSESKSKNWYNILLSIGHTVVSKTKLGTAMDTILILIVLVSLPCLIIYAFTEFWLLLVIALCPVGYFIRVYEFFMRNDRKMLRTEKHEETMFKISSALGQKGLVLPEEEIDALPATTKVSSIKVSKLNNSNVKKGTK